MAEASEREEKRTVHEDVTVTESPGASTTIFVKVAPGPIQAPGLEVPCGARIKEVLQQTAVRLQSTISAGSKSTKPNPHPVVRRIVLAILGRDGIGWLCRSARLRDRST